MIGVGVSINNTYLYVCFTINPGTIPKKSLDNYIWCDDEKMMINKFSEYVNLINCGDNINTRLIHWSSAEPSVFNSKLLEHNIKLDFPWFDLLNVFKYSQHPIIIKECHSFGLKNIVNKLNEYKFIDLCWSSLDDGLLSAFIASDIYNNKLNNDKLIELIEYNYIDCYALHKLLNFIRNYIKK